MPEGSEIAKAVGAMQTETRKDNKQISLGLTSALWELWSKNAFRIKYSYACLVH